MAAKLWSPTPIIVTNTAMASMPALWWKFSVQGGDHLFRAKNVGQADQEIFLDGIPLDAPVGTYTFTGPAATLLELQQQANGCWVLCVDNTPAEPYDPSVGPVDALPILWWKFEAPGLGNHLVRVKNIGLASQEFYLDGSLIEAPPGTTLFTGPGGKLLELRSFQTNWSLFFDGVEVLAYNPLADPTDTTLVWNFTQPGTGNHQFCVTGAGKPGQEVYLNGERIITPEGELTFTGPGGTLLELKLQNEEWVLCVDGELMKPLGIGAFVGDQPEKDVVWTFMSPQKSTHQMQVEKIGQPNQVVSIDRTTIPAPGTQRAFTGPGGVLLELKQKGQHWALFVDGLPVDDSNAKFAAAPDGMTAPAPKPQSANDSLPQGVSYDAASGAYTANICVKGKFKFLGEFKTPDEAHLRYLGAKQEMKT